MALKNPVYKYQYKPQAVTYFKPKLEEKEALAKSVGTQVTNLEKRFQNVGVPTEKGSKEADQRNIIEKALNLKANQGVLMDILEVLNRPTQVVTNILSSLGEQDKRDALTAAWEGLSGKKEIGARQALANLTGDPNLLKIKADNKSFLDDIAQFTIDLGLEIAADPGTWISLGAGAISKGTKAAKTAAREAAEALVQQADEFYKAGAGAAQLLEAGETAQDATRLAANLAVQRKPLLDEAARLLEYADAPTFGGRIKQAGAAAVKTAKDTIKQWTISAIRTLPNDSARSALGFIRGVRNVATKTGHLFNAMKDIGEGLRGELDKVFNISSSKLNTIKRNLFNLNDTIETSLNLTDDVARQKFTKEALDSALKEKVVAEAAVDTAQKTLTSLENQLNALAGTKEVVAKNKLTQEIAKAKQTLKLKARAVDKITRAANKLDDILKVGSRKYYREALYELYEAGFKIGKDGNFLFDLANAPRSTLKFADVAEDLFTSRRRTFKSRRIPVEKMDDVFKQVSKIVNDVNEKVGEKFLTASSIDDYISIDLRLPEPGSFEALTPLGAAGEQQDFLSRYKKAFDDVTASGTKKDLYGQIDLGKTPFSEEAQDLFKSLGNDKMNEIFKKIKNIEDNTGDLLYGTTTGAKYAPKSLFKGELPDSMRYLRRVKTEEFVKKIRGASKYEAFPALREVVSGTGKELSTRVYRGTVREYNDVMRLFYKSEVDEFSQDIIKSLTDYVRVAESRFSMSEITRLVFGLDVAPEEGAKGVKLAFDEAPFSQADQFMMPVDELVNPQKPLIQKNVPAGPILDKTGTVVGYKAEPQMFVNKIKSDVVTKEMAKEFSERFPNFRILDDGFAYLDKSGKRVAGGEFADLVNSLPDELRSNVLKYLQKNGMLGKKMAIHRSAYELLKNAQNAYKINTGAAVGLFDKFLTKWKELSLLSPSFHIRNWIGNWSNMSLAGMDPQDILKETSDAWKQIAQREELLKKAQTVGLTAQEQVLLSTFDNQVSGLAAARRGVRDLEELAAARKFDVGLDKKLSGSLKESYDKLVAANFQVSERADEIQRLAMLNYYKKKGLSQAQALQKVREVLFDYGNLTSFEKNVMKRFFPFYTFMKENMIFQFKNGLKNTGRYKNLFRGYKHYLEEVADVKQEDLPAYMTGNMWLPLPFTVNKNDKEAISFLKLNLPASDFLEFVENPLKKATSSIAVPIKATWEFLSGIDTFTGAPIKKFPGEKSIYRGQGGVLDFLRNEKGEFDVSKDPVIKKFADDLGFRTVRKPLTLLLDSIDTIMGKKNPGDAALSLLEQSGFVTTKTRQEIDLTALYQKLEYLRNLKRLYEQNTGATLPTVKESSGYLFKPK